MCGPVKEIHCPWCGNTCFLNAEFPLPRNICCDGEGGCRRLLYRGGSRYWKTYEAAAETKEKGGE